MPPLPGRIPRIYLGLSITLTLVVGFGPLGLFAGDVERARGGWPAFYLVFGPLAFAALSTSHLPARYYQGQDLERSGRLYEARGVRHFRLVVPNGDLINRIARKFEPRHRVIRNEASIEKFELRTLGAEKFHLAAFMVMIPASVYTVILGWYGYLAWLVLPSIPLHIYPILLQRYTRARIERVRKRYR